MPETEQKQPQQQPVQQTKPRQNLRKKKKKASKAKHILSLVGMCAGLFAVVSLLTFAAITLRQRKEQSANVDEAELEILEPNRSFSQTEGTTARTTTLTADLTTADITDLSTTDLTTGDTTETTTVSTRYIPGEEEYPYFTRKYTYPHEAELTETLSRKTTATTATTVTTTTVRQADPASLLYVNYGAALKQFLTNAGEADTEPMYALTDLNGDDTPELIISGGTSPQAQYAVYTFADGVLTELKSESGKAFGHLFLCQESADNPPVLIEICEAENKTDTYYYAYDGSALKLLHSFSDDNGNYFADGHAVSAEEYAAQMYLTPQQNAGREIALPTDAEALTEVGGYSL